MRSRISAKLVEVVRLNGGGAGCHDRFYSRRPFGGEVFLLTSPFIELTFLLKRSPRVEEMTICKHYGVFGELLAWLSGKEDGRPDWRTLQDGIFQAGINRWSGPPAKRVSPITVTIYQSGPPFWVDVLPLMQCTT